MLKVYDGVPIPGVNRTASARRIYPIATMKVGQMFFRPGASPKSVSAYVSRITKDLPQRFITQRCWAIETPDGFIEVSSDATGGVEGVGIWRVA